LIRAEPLEVYDLDESGQGLSSAVLRTVITTVGSRRSGSCPEFFADDSHELGTVRTAVLSHVLWQDGYNIVSSSAVLRTAIATPVDTVLSDNSLVLTSFLHIFQSLLQFFIPWLLSACCLLILIIIQAAVIPSASSTCQRKRWVS
jgi:hypothetical protein